MKSEYGEVPAICREVGLTCKLCTEDTARSLASVCKGLRGKAITQLFYQIYPVAVCSGMSSHFVRSYKAASAEAPKVHEDHVSLETIASGVSPEPAQPEFIKPDFERREVTSNRRRAYAAAS